MTHIPRVACAKCGLQMQASIGKNILVTCEYGSYYLVSADLFTCPECRCEILAGWANRPYAHHFNHDFKEQEAKTDLVVDLEPHKFCTPYHVRRVRTRREALAKLHGIETGRIEKCSACDGTRMVGGVCDRGHRAATVEVRKPDTIGHVLAEDAFVGKHMLVTDEVPTYQDLVDRLMASVGPFNQEAADAIVDLNDRIKRVAYARMYGAGKERENR